VSITELDVTIRGTSGGQLEGGFGRRRARTATPASPEDLKAQADAYARLFAIFVKHEGVIERVTFWGLSDRRTWRFGQHPLIFDGNNQRKPCYVSITDVLSSPRVGVSPP
jgi:GH35 family endo-1,4-beta-xylanase